MPQGAARRRRSRPTAAIGWALTMGLVAAPALGRDPRPEGDVGRFSAGLTDCRIDTPGFQSQRRPCGRLRIEQNLEGLLSVRFSLVDAPERVAGATLVFAGVLDPSSKPMRCRGDGRCTPRLPLQLSVNAIATTLAHDRDGTTSLPRSRLAAGHCRIDALAAHCQATGRDGTQWQASGFLPVQPPPTAKDRR